MEWLHMCDPLLPMTHPGGRLPQKAVTSGMLNSLLPRFPLLSFPHHLVDFLWLLSEMATVDAPPGSVQAQQQSAQVEHMQRIIADDTSKGASVHVFDPDAPPEKKASEAAKKQDALKPYTVSDGDTPRAKGASRRFHTAKQRVTFLV